MTDISSLPYEVILQIVKRLSMNDLELLAKAFAKYHDNSVLLMTFIELSKNGLIISDTKYTSMDLLNHPTYAGGWEYYNSPYSFRCLQDILKFNEVYKTNIVPKVIQFDLKLTDTLGIRSFREEVMHMLNFSKYKKWLSMSVFYLTLRLENKVALSKVYKMLEYFGNVIGNNVVAISLIGYKSEIDLDYIKNRFNRLEFLKINMRNSHQTTFNYPLKTNSLAFEDMGILEDVIIPQNIISLTLKDVSFRYSSTTTFPKLEALTICNVDDISDFVLQNLSSELKYLKLESISFESPGFIFSRLSNLKSLILLDMSDDYHYQFKFPPNLITLVIQDEYLPFIDVDYKELPLKLENLVLRGDRPSQFDDIDFPKGLRSLVLQGGEGMFQCENFKCPPRLERLIITLQRFKNVHKFKLANTVKELNLSSNSIRKIGNMKLPSNIENLCLSNNGISSITNFIFPMNIREIDLTQAYTLQGEFDFTKYKLLSTANIFLGGCNAFKFNDNVNIINDYDWRIDNEWRNREVKYFY